jgi:hypothetical protein
MHFQTIAIIIACISGILASVAVLVAIPRFAYHRGQAEKELVLSLKAITKANEDLSADYKTFRDKTIETFHAHDLRIVRLEPYSNGNGSRRR